LLSLKKLIENIATKNMLLFRIFQQKLEKQNSQNPALKQPFIVFWKKIIKSLSSVHTHLQNNQKIPVTCFVFSCYYTTAHELRINICFYYEVQQPVRG